MKVKHWQGYGSVEVKKISKKKITTMYGEKKTELVLQVKGNHEWGLVRDDVYDVRRWMEDGDKFMNIHRMEITKNENGSFTYNKVAFTRGDGKWQSRWNLFPFSQTEIMKSGNAIVQNPGW
jgi:hypothetical protein